MKSICLTETHPPGSLLRCARKDNKTKLASSFGGSGGNAADRGSYVILSASEIPHRTIAPPNKLSLRGSIATAAISREGGGLRSICSVLFQGIATLALAMTYFFYLSLRRSVATAAIPWSKVRSICSVLFRWDISLALNMTCFVLGIATPAARNDTGIQTRTAFITLTP